MLNPCFVGLLLMVFIRPHHNASHKMRSIVNLLPMFRGTFVCLSFVNHDRELCKKWMSRSSAVWVVDLGMGSKNIIIGAGPPTLELERLKIILGNAHGRHTECHSERGSSSAAAGYC